MAGLLGVVRAQAVQLAALARSDALTGRPEPPHLGLRALPSLPARPATRNAPLTVAVLDLDHFKAYNDTARSPGR